MSVQKATLCKVGDLSPKERKQLGLEDVPDHVEVAL